MTRPAICFLIALMICGAGDWPVRGDGPDKPKGNPATQPQATDPDISVDAYLAAITPKQDATNVKTLQNLFDVLDELAAARSAETLKFTQGLVDLVAAGKVEVPDALKKKLGPDGGPAAESLTPAIRLEFSRCAVEAVTVIDNLRRQQAVAGMADVTLPAKLLEHIARHSPTLSGRALATSAYIGASAEVEIRSKYATGFNPADALALMDGLMDGLRASAKDRTPRSEAMAALTAVIDGDVPAQWLQLKATSMEKPTEESLKKVVDDWAKSVEDLKEETLPKGADKVFARWEKKGAPYLRDMTPKMAALAQEVAPAKLAIAQFFTAVNSGDRKTVAAMMVERKQAKLDKLTSLPEMFGTGVVRVDVVAVRPTGHVGQNLSLLLTLSMQTKDKTSTVTTTEVEMRKVGDSYVFGR